ncbi:hypothetical protein LJC35_05500 [Parabacteroides sp. OttesenSCG-928-N08]|nr:hypothetical protein [Parabacteroides sp. OttesenSCG-928-N08]
MKQKLCYLIVLLAFCGGAMAQSGYWTDEGNYSTDWYDGSGKYTIRSAEELAGVAWLVANRKITFADEMLTLVEDLDLSAHYWVPIGLDYETTFGGSFDGSGKSIQGLTIKHTAEWDANAGLFGYIYLDGHTVTIQQLTLKGGSVQGGDGPSSFTGALIGFVRSSDKGGDVVLREIHNEGVDVIGGKTPSSSFVGSSTGGLIGKSGNNSGSDSCNLTLLDCSNSGEIVGGESENRTYTGGLIGSCSTDTGLLEFSRCSNVGEVVGGQSWSYTYAAGLIGYVEAYQAPLRLTDCSNSASVTASSAGNSNSCGGLIGESRGILMMHRCLNNGEVIGAGSYNDSNTGGLIGSGSGTLDIIDCLNSGDVTGGNAEISFCTGGLFGKLMGYESTIIQVKQCYSYATISALSKCMLGGLVGIIEAKNNSTVRLSQCYVAGSIHDMSSGIDEFTGGIVGMGSGVEENGPMVEDCLVAIEEMEANVKQRIAGFLFGNVSTFLSNNYAYVAGNDTWINNTSGLDGADWDGTMNTLPISNWDADSWIIDETGRYLPRLRSVEESQQPKVENPVGNAHILSLEEDGIAVSSMPGQLRIDARYTATLQIYTPTGVLYYTAEVGEGTTMLPLPAGAWIIRVGDSTWKLLVTE